MLLAVAQLVGEGLRGGAEAGALGELLPVELRRVGKFALADVQVFRPEVADGHPRIQQFEVGVELVSIGTGVNLLRQLLVGQKFAALAILRLFDVGDEVVDEGVGAEVEVALVEVEIGGGDDEVFGFLGLLHLPQQVIRVPLNRVGLLPQIDVHSRVEFIDLFFFGKGGKEVVLTRMSEAHVAHVEHVARGAEALPAAAVIDLHFFLAEQRHLVLEVMQYDLVGDGHHLRDDLVVPDEVDHHLLLCVVEGEVDVGGASARVVDLVDLLDQVLPLERAGLGDRRQPVVRNRVLLVNAFLSQRLRQTGALTLVQAMAATQERELALVLSIACLDPRGSPRRVLERVFAGALRRGRVGQLIGVV